VYWIPACGGTTRFVAPANAGVEETQHRIPGLRRDDAS
jgi:hypothetical protein